MARLPVFHSQANISATSPVQPIENPMWGEVNKMAQAGKALAVQWQEIKNKAETSDGKEKLKRGFDAILKDANNFNNYNSQADLDKAEKDLIERNNKLMDEVLSGFTNEVNATRFRQDYSLMVDNNNTYISKIFRDKTGDLSRANSVLSYERNKENFIATGNQAYKEEYLNDLQLASPFYSREEMAKMKLKVEDWDYDYAINEATKDPEGTLADLGRFGLNSDQTYDVEKRAKAVIAGKKAQLKNGKSEEEAMQISMTQQINKQMFEDQWKSDNGKIQKDMNSIFEFRSAIQEKFIANELKKEDYVKLQANTIAPLLEKVKNHSAGNPIWWNTSFDEAIRGVDAKVDLASANDEVKAYVYDLVYSSLKEKNVDPDKRFGRDDKAIGEIVEKVSAEYLRNKEPNLLGVEANKVLLGTKMFDYKLDGGGKEVKPQKYQLMQDKNGVKYKVYADKDGKYTDNSIMERVQ